MWCCVVLRFNGEREEHFFPSPPPLIKLFDRVEINSPSQLQAVLNHQIDYPITTFQLVSMNKIAQIALYLEQELIQDAP